MTSAGQTELQNRFKDAYLLRRPARVVELHEALIEGRTIFVCSTDTEDDKPAQPAVHEFIELVQEAIDRQDFSGVKSLCIAVFAKFPGTQSPGAFYQLACQSSRRLELMQILKDGKPVFSDRPELIAIINQAVKDLDRV